MAPEQPAALALFQLRKHKPMTVAQRLRDEVARLPHGVWTEWHRIMIEAADEIDRLNKWADGFSDAQLKERRLCEARIQEMQKQIDKYGLALMMIREGCADPRRFAAEMLSKVSPHS